MSVQPVQGDCHAAGSWTGGAKAFVAINGANPGNFTGCADRSDIADNMSVHAVQGDCHAAGT